MGSKLVAVGSKISFDSAGGAVRFGFLAGLMLTGAQLIHILIHEVLGHGLSTFLLGLSVGGVYVSPFGGYSVMQSSPVSWLAALQYSSGILVSSAIGIVLLLIYPRLNKCSVPTRLFFILLILALESDLLYGFLSPLFGFGDIALILSVLGIGTEEWPLAALVFVPLFIPVFYAIFRVLLDFGAPFARPASTGAARFRLLAKIAVLPVIFFVAFLFVGGMVFFPPDYAIFMTIAGLCEIVLALPMLWLASVKPVQAKKTVSATQAQAAFSGMAKDAAISAITALAVMLLFAAAHVPAA